jgi:hypothetical protein
MQLQHSLYLERGLKQHSIQDEHRAGAQHDELIGQARHIWALQQC